MQKIRISQQAKVVVLTGAGISAESGIRTFRDNNGLWEEQEVEDVATPEAFQRDPELVWRFYKERLAQLQQVKPNPAHFALLQLQQHCRDFVLITQNVDGLHQKAGSKDVWQMHGALDKAFCTKCQTRFSLQQIDLQAPLPTCSLCGAALRPDIVWFGELPYYLDEIQQALQRADYFLAIGTSGLVYPAAQFIQLAQYFGAQTICVNLEKPQNSMFSDYFFQGKSGEILPKLVAEWTK
ncbi:MAG: NAD-dependent deacylase [Candidatus Cloacimonadales bacterium]